MNVCRILGFGGLLLLGLLSPTRECAGVEGEWVEWIIWRVDNGDQEANADVVVAAASTGFPPVVSETQDTGPTYAETEAYESDQDNNTFAEGNMSTWAELYESGSEPGSIVIASAFQETYAYADSTQQGAGVSARAGQDSTIAGGEFVVQNPPPGAISTKLAAIMVFSEINLIGQTVFGDASGSNNGGIIIEVGDSQITAYHGFGASDGKWKLEGILQTSTGPVLIDEEVDEPLDVFFVAEQDVAPEEPFKIEVSVGIISTATVWVQSAPGTEERGATIAGEVSVFSWYYHEP